MSFKKIQASTANIGKNLEGINKHLKDLNNAAALSTISSSFNSLSKTITSIFMKSTEFRNSFQELSKVLSIAGATLGTTLVPTMQWLTGIISDLVNWFI
nr:hypothetical protein 2 [bacterium]